MEESVENILLRIGGSEYLNREHRELISNTLNTKFIFCNHLIFRMHWKLFQMWIFCKLTHNAFLLFRWISFWQRFKNSRTKLHLWMKNWSLKWVGPCSEWNKENANKVLLQNTEIESEDFNCQYVLMWGCCHEYGLLIVSSWGVNLDR